MNGAMRVKLPPQICSPTFLQFLDLRNDIFKSQLEESNYKPPHVLLSGPPGNGKTLIMDFIASSFRERVDPNCRVCANKLLACPPALSSHLPCQGLPVHLNIFCLQSGILVEGALAHLYFLVYVQQTCHSNWQQTALEVLEGKSITFAEMQNVGGGVP